MKIGNSSFFPCSPNHFWACFFHVQSIFQNEFLGFWLRGLGNGALALAKKVEAQRQSHHRCQVVSSSSCRDTEWGFGYQALANGTLGMGLWLWEWRFGYEALHMKFWAETVSPSRVSSSSCGDTETKGFGYKTLANGTLGMGLWLWE